MKVLLKFVKFFIAIIVVALLFAVMFRFVAQRVESSESKKNNDISERQVLILGDYEQRILVESKDINNPVLIVMGEDAFFPYIFGMGYRNVHQDLTKEYMLVQYDQFGNGINYTDSVVSISTHVNMVVDLVKTMHKIYPTKDIYLLGMGKNSVITIMAADTLKDQLTGLITYNPFISYELTKSEIKWSLDKLKLSANEISVLKTSMGNKTVSDYEKVVNLGEKYLDIKNTDYSEYYMYLYRLFKSPDYTLDDVFNILNFDSSTPYKKYNEQLLSVDMMSTISNLVIPHLIINGKYNYLTPTSSIKKIKNDNIIIKSLDNTSTRIETEDFADFYKYILDFKNE